MKTKTIFIAGLVFIAGVIVAVVVNVNRPVAPVVAGEPAPAPAPPPEVSSAGETSPPEIAAAVPTQPLNRVETNVTVKAARQPVTAQTAPPANGPLQDPVAREALSLVGADPDAEQYWAAAIFDPSLPDQEREDLMEDLNEDGLSDPQHPGPQDLPLIVNRLRIISELAPYADDFMLEHLGEAYKDLVGLLNGQPPQ